MDKKIAPWALMALCVMAAAGCAAGAICEVSNETDLAAAIDVDQDCEIRILSWPEDDLTVDVVSHSPEKTVTILAANIKTLRVANVSALSIGPVVEVEEIVAEDVWSLQLDALPALRTIEATMGDVDREQLIGLCRVPALESASIEGTSTGQMQVTLCADLDFDTLDLAIDAGLAPTRLLRAGGNIPLSQLQTLGSRMEGVYLRGVPDEVLLPYRDWLVGEAFTGDLCWVTETDTETECSRRLLPE